MSVQPPCGVQVPEPTARVARASNPQGKTAVWVRDRLDGLWTDDDFTAWYSRGDGRPGISPAQLATVCVLQFLLNLSGRQAAEAVRCRVDFTYALGLELEDLGFHRSVLTDFRDRLAEAGRADRLLDLALARLAAAGLVKQRGAQRTDSTHVLAAARDLTRVELVTEAVRAALEELVDPAWRKRHALRSGAEGTIAEFALGHQARRCRYRGTAKTHVQLVLTAIAVNIERLSQHDPQATPTRRPTAFQQYTDSRHLPRPLWWRQGKYPPRSPTESLNAYRTSRSGMKYARLV